MIVFVPDGRSAALCSRGAIVFQALTEGVGLLGPAVAIEVD